MQQLNYNLTVHNPFRPVEGLMIDLKVYKFLHISCMTRVNINIYAINMHIFIDKI
jgi:hypothetical protein